MTAVAHPLLVVGLGPMGTRVARDLASTAAAIRTDGDAPHAILTDLGGSSGRLRRAFTAAASGLLESGRGGVDGRARLDIAVAADLLELDEEELASFVGVIADVLADDFPVLFPPSAPAEQRSVWLTVFLGTPALVATPDGLAVVERLRRLDGRRDQLRHPALSRVLLLPRQTRGGRLSDDALESMLRATLQLLYVSGSRDDDRIRRVLAHRDDGRVFAQVGVATAELPIARIRRYARLRLALSGVQSLLDQAEVPTTDPGRAEALRQQLDPEALLADFVDGGPADRVRARAAQLSGAEDSLPSSWSVSLTERPMDLRARYRVLFEAIAKPWNRRIDPTADPDHEAMLRLLDAVEADTLAAADRRLVQLLDEQLEPSTALRVLPALEHALKQAVHTLDEELAAAAAEVPSPEPPPPPVDPGLVALEHTIDGRPGLRSTWPVLLALSLGCMVCTVLAWAWAVAPAPVATVSSSPLAPTSTESWAIGLLVGLLVAGIWQIAVLWVWRTEARTALARRTHELETAWRAGGAGQEREQAERLLAVRRRRTANDLRRRYVAALERLGALRAAMRQSSNTLAASLADLRVRLGPLPAEDDLSGLIGSDSPLQTSLVDPARLAGRLEDAGLHRDLQRWATQMLTETWPAHGGLQEDLPCADVQALLDVCERALDGLSMEGLLGEGAQRTAATHGFLQTAVPALGWGVEPRDAHGDPVRGRGRDRRLLVAPASSRGRVESSLADSPIQLDTCWTSASVPWIGVVALWDGHRLEEVERGMGVVP